MKTPLWKREWVIGLLIVILVLIVYRATPLIGNLERSVYDMGVRGSDRSPQDNISILAIDDSSINNIGRWPWSRDVHAAMIDKLSGAGAKVIAYTPVFSEAQIDPGLQFIKEMAGYYQVSGITQQPVAGVPNLLQQHRTSIAKVTGPARGELLTSFGAIQKSVNEVENFLEQAQNSLDMDKVLTDSITKAGNVLTPMLVDYRYPQGNPDSELPDYVQKYAIQNIQDNIGAQGIGDASLPMEISGLEIPIQEIGLVSNGIGYINYSPYSDDGARTLPLVVNYYGTYLPSYALLIAARSLNLDMDDITVNLGEGVQLGRLNIGTDGQSKMFNFFYRSEDGGSIFPVDSFFDVLNDKVPVSKYKDKIVIVGTNASGVSKPQITPISSNLSEAEALAHTVASILNEDFFTIPAWTGPVEFLVFLLIAGFIMFVLPKLKAQMGAIVSASLLLALFLASYISMTQQAVWLQLMLPAALLITGYVILTTKQFLVIERGKLHSDMESAESNKMLGLAFQGQGQLDMAFEKFRRCPKDDSTSEVLYNLALDYERKRQFSKAGNVYQYISQFNPKFRDVEQRIARSKKMEDTIILGGKAGGGTAAGGTLIMDGSDVEKPMLGRYQIQKELGKGAMGVVYQGIDPKISRIVAIKTMALSQEFDADELEDVKQRFFREAETAGRLNHPNIVTIYDAGEEHDLAYIAMEFLKGHDLNRYTKKDKLLPIKTVLQIIERAADALNYAHSQNVVHRDIKPANIMYEPESGQIKITDFGIARITDSSKTKTGVVLGTPSYMSPEQLAGRKVDGRSDLFSLGVMLFQMLSGQLPFQADSMATLMYKIANETPPSILELNPELPPILEVVVVQAMEKKAEDRYQNGAEMAAMLQQCLKQLA
ncbi:MAG TPA: serine/threonine-protein kinase [Gammaproteobacteria bacterium]|nr:serine/threonine-protein kinase [Gammaproteobacteria bacterium]